ncbi:MAG TPA: FtsX-like permease family protein, partial [Anaerolineaceae bacterium]
MRTVLVVASISVGLFAVGMIGTIRGILVEDMRSGYAAVNPTNLQVYAANFDDDMVDTVRSVPGVKEANPVTTVDLMARTGPDEWSRITLQAIPDFKQMTINRVALVSGQWPPQDKQIVIERTKLANLYYTRPGYVDLKLPSGTIRQAPLVGVVHDQTVGIASTGGGFFTAPIQGFVTQDTLEWLEKSPDYNLLYVTVSEQPDDETHLREVSNRVTKALEDNGGLVYNAMIRGSHDHPNASYVDAITGVLYFLGLLVVFLSGFLITNTLQALMGQQAQQIAIMKTIGARSYQVTTIYVALIAAFGLLALLFAVPLSREAAFSLLAFLSARINFDVARYRTVFPAVMLQVAIAFIVPQVAGIVPILNGARLKVQDTLTGALTESDPTRAGWLDRRLAALSLGKRRLPRPLLISLRNTFRHKGRLALTLLTLTLGGAIFIATFNVQASMEAYIRKLGHYFAADVNLTMNNPYRIAEIQEALRHVPGVGRVEGWAFARCELLLDNDKAGDAVQLLGPPVTSTLIQPILIKGRWIQSGDQDAIVLSERFMTRFPNLRVGDPIRLRVNGEKTTWQVVGFFQLAGKSAGFIAYTGYDYLAAKIHEPNQAVTFRITGDRPNLTQPEQRALSVRISAYLQDRGFDVSEADTGTSLITRSAGGLNTLTAFLLMMAILIAIVGSIGLMGTMSMNVMDRTREIGVLRAIGASDRAVMNMVLVEGLLIGGISWVLGTLLAIPISQLLSDTIHLAIFSARADFTFTPLAPLYWLALV